MTIEWHGYSCITIEGKGKEATTVLLDPRAPDGKVLKRAGESVVVFTAAVGERPSGAAGAKSEGLRLLDAPGEYDIGGVAILLFTASRDPLRLLASVTMEGITVLHCGGLSVLPEQALLERFEAVDVLLLPVGGGDSLAAKAAAELVRELEPHCVIPLRYKTAANQGTFEPLNAFLKEMGVSTQATPEKRVRFTREEVREAEMKVVVLEGGA